MPGSTLMDFFPSPLHLGGTLLRCPPTISFIYFWLCWVFVAARGLSLVAVGGLLIAVASLVAEHGL